MQRTLSHPQERFGRLVRWGRGETGGLARPVVFFLLKGLLIESFFFFFFFFRGFEANTPGFRSPFLFVRGLLAGQIQKQHTQNLRRDPTTNNTPKHQPPPGVPGDPKEFSQNRLGRTQNYIYIYLHTEKQPAAAILEKNYVQHTCNKKLLRNKKQIYTQNTRKTHKKTDTKTKDSHQKTEKQQTERKPTKDGAINKNNKNRRKQ